MAKREKKEPAKPSTAWLGTYGDMITLMLCFFVAMYDPSDSDAVQMAQLQASVSNNNNGGGQSLSAARLSDLGNTVSSLPALERGIQLGPAKKKAVTIFEPDTKNNRITVTSDERGLVISLLSDTFFEQGSADLNIEECRDTLLRLSSFFNEPEVSDKKFRIEGHTDDTPVSAESEFPSNWELSTARAANVLHYLSALGVNEKQFSIAGYANNQPMFDNGTPEGKAYNRRVDIIILDEGHF
ncbi:MAG: flagellar motor protein MotB [Treponema sp.]|nr:flagellar motor protein MotB [Treponema sp.]MBR6079952.1 flagellar motor protein MotB [Treponema sp.]MBR6193224.1 flagellar motor protein MotB [Treponema sp.]